MSWTALLLREYHEHMRPSGRFSGHMIAAAAMSVIFGAGATVAAGLIARGTAPLFLPGASLHWHAASAMLAGLLGGGFTAIFIPMNLGVEAVAGERERHTLATLATSPLTDGQIVHAKSLAILLVCATIAALGGAAVFITLIVLYAEIGLLWGLLAIPAAIVFVILPAYCMTGWAMAISTRAKTVKDASQKMAAVLMPLLMVYPVLSLVGTIGPGGPWSLLPILVGGAALLLLLLGPVLAFVRFRRERLLTV